MAAPFIKGVGAVAALTTTLDDNYLFPLFPFSVEYARETAKIEAKGQVLGTLSTLASDGGEVTDTLTISTQYLDWATMGFFLNELSTEEASPTGPVLKSALIPTTSPYTISDAAIAVGTTFVTVQSSNDGLQVRKMISGSATPSAGEAKVASGSLTFNSADGGKLAYYQVAETFAATQSYGGANTGKLGTFQLVVKTFPNEHLLLFPRCDITGTPTISASGTEASTWEVEVTPAIPTELGYTKPYKWLNRPTLPSPSPGPS